MNIKKYEEVKILQDKTLNEIKRDFKAQTIITAILVILALIICFKAWDTAVKCEELEKYKRSPEDTREIDYGDLNYLLDNSKEIFHSYNINDAGDIYIRNYNSINSLKDEAVHYEGKMYFKSRGRIANYILEDVSKHHNYIKIYEIIEKYFEIA